jgi:hypothetical protein
VEMACLWEVGAVMIQPLLDEAMSLFSTLRRLEKT